MSRTTTVTDQVIENMRKKIISGEWAIGAKIPSESELCREYDCSRTSVRTAISQLNALGAVKTRRGSGTVVLSAFPVLVPEEMREQNLGEGRSEDSLHLLRNWRQARFFLEPAIVEQVAVIATDEQIAQLKRINQEQYECIGRQQEYIDKDREFHLTIAMFLGNELLTGILQDLLAQNDMMQICNEEFGYNGGYFHMMITAAIERHDAQAAKSLMEEHLAEIDDFFGLKKSNFK